LSRWLSAHFFAACVAEEVARGVIAAVLSAVAGNVTKESIVNAVLANWTGAPLDSQRFFIHFDSKKRKT
jgi:hypothetical protein